MASTLANRLGVAHSYLTRSTTVPSGPQALLLETTADCNLTCPMCWRTVTDYPTNLLPDEHLYPALDDFAAMGGDFVLLYALGEPLLDPRIFEILAYARKLKLGTIISTNGTLLTEARRKRLLEVGCDHFIVGIDAVSEGTYNRYRTGGNYSKVVANTRALAAEKLAANSPMQLVAQFIRMADNLHEEAAFKRFWGSVPGIDIVRIKDEDFGLDHRMFDSDAANRLNPCYMLWRGPLIVRSTGDVLACHWMGWHEMGVLGNLRETSLRDCWASPQLEALRAMHIAGNIPADSPCATCPAPRPRLPFLLGGMVAKGTQARGLLPIAEKLELAFPNVFKEPRIPREV